MTGLIYEENYDNPKICTGRILLSLINGSLAYESRLVSIKFVVKKTLTSALIGEKVSIERSPWLRLNNTEEMEADPNPDPFIVWVIENFRAFLLLQGYFRNDATELRDETKTYFRISKPYSVFRSLANFDEKYDVFFKKNYLRIIGRYIGFKDKNVQIEILSFVSGKIKLRSSLCPGKILDAKIDPETLFGGSASSEKDFKLGFGLVYLDFWDSISECIKDGRYVFIEKNY